jgi:plastocyanin
MDVFYVFGIVLVLAALVGSYVGIRGAGTFPPRRAILVAGTSLFATLVVVTLAFAIDLSEEEQAHREAELAHEEEQAQAENTGEAEPVTPGGQPQASGGGNQQAPQEAIPTEEIDVSSPADGALVFDPDGLEAQAGNLTINYDNPSQVPHSIAVETAQGDLLGETQPATGGVQTLQVRDLAPGEYVFYCTVPGHREAGMQGDLTVTGGPTP